MSRLSGLALALLLTAWSPPAKAHPHVWVDAAIGFVFENGTVVALAMEWTFDQFFSNMLLADFDKNKNKRFEEPEAKALHDGAFVALKDAGYFTHVRSGGRSVAVGEARDFSAVVSWDQVTYRFVARLAEPLDPRAAPLIAGVYDEAYYIDLALAQKDPVALLGEGSKGCRHQIVEDKETPLYFGMVFPKVVHLAC